MPEQMKYAYVFKNGLHALNLKIGGTLVRMRSAFTPVDLLKKPLRPADDRLPAFVPRGNARPDIEIDVGVTPKLPPLPKKDAFRTFHPDDNKENWRLAPVKDGYIFNCRLSGKRQQLHVSKDFSRVRALMQAKRPGGLAWDPLDLVYDFLQILLIFRLAKQRRGLLLHACALKETDGNGYVFAGKSGAGKSTLSLLWHKNSRAAILNDDRVLVEFQGRKTLIYNSPWHGEVGGQLPCLNEAAPLGKIFFLKKAKHNRLNLLAPDKAFEKLYPCVFPPFWDKEAIKDCLAMSAALLARVPCYQLEFRKDKSAVAFIRAENRKK